jgi:NADPH-dependent 2,4-dienoyl-CoA reductase/sulfur reductase-like enzyme/nitrite reductase/ring-hydroxylating ferredoxin subunit
MQGVAAAELGDGHMLVGHVGDEQVLLVRRGQEIFAVGAYCSHYHAPLAKGLVVGEEIRCPWHHACFNLRTGEAKAPAFDAIACWIVEHAEDKIFVREKRPVTKPRAAVRRSRSAEPNRIVIVGGGAAGFAAAEMLRRERYEGSVTLISQENTPPVDRPNLSKDFLAGTAPEAWVALRPDSFYAENGIELQVSTEVAAINSRAREVVLADGRTFPYDRLLLATGAEPLRPSIPGAEPRHVHTLRSLADCRAILARAATARRAVVLGASFIGLEVAAALRKRNIEVHVVAPETRPMERILGAEMGDHVRRIHEEHGVIFHLGDIAVAIDGQVVVLRSGRKLAVDLVVAGIGVRPRTMLAEKARLALDRGVVVNGCLETSAAGIFAAGDIARWPDPHSGQSIRVEHWAVAERQGQTAALNMLGRRERFSAVPFFWSQHYDIPINYVGYGEAWDDLSIDGDIASNDCLLRFKRNNRVVAVASIFRDVDNLKAEVAMETASQSREYLAECGYPPRDIAAQSANAG